MKKFSHFGCAAVYSKHVTFRTVDSKRLCKAFPDDGVTCIGCQHAGDSSRAASSGPRTGRDRQNRLEGGAVWSRSIQECSLRISFRAAAAGTTGGNAEPRIGSKKSGLDRGSLVLINLVHANTTSKDQATKRAKKKTLLPVMGLRHSVLPLPAPPIVDPNPPDGLEVLMSQAPASLQLQLANSWNPKDCSGNLVVKDEGLSVWRKPRAQFSDTIRGRCGYTCGLHVWEIDWPINMRGTHAMVGVATDQAPLQVNGYTSLLGDNNESWGWNLSRRELCHCAKGRRGVLYPAAKSDNSTAKLPDKIVVVLDMEEGSLGFMVDGEYLGTAFGGLKGKKLYPAVSAVWGQCEVRIRYIGHQKAVPRPLMQLCRRTVHKALGNRGMHQVKNLPLPMPLRRYLQYK